MKFVLEIELGNEGMQSGEQVAGAIRRVATKIDSPFDNWEMEGDQGIIRDINGNTVGKWVVMDDSPLALDGLPKGNRDMVIHPKERLR